MKPRFVNLAKRAARGSKLPFRVGAVIIHRNQVISLGTNKAKTHPRSMTAFKAIHAELDAVLGVPLEELRGSTMYVIRITNSELIAMAKPCIHCMALLRQVGIRKIFYSTEKRQIEEITIPTNGG